MITKAMWSRMAAKNWQEAFPGGNGHIGIMAMGDPLEEKVIVNHEKLFLPVHGRIKMPDMSEYLPEIRQLIKDGKFREAAVFFVEKSRKKGLPPNLGPDYFHPAFDLRVSSSRQGTVTGFRRSLDFTSGEIVTSWLDNGNMIKRKLFVSRPDNVIVMNISSAVGILPRCEFWLTESGGKTNEEFETINEYIKQTEININDNSPGYRCQYNKGGGYTGIARIIAANGVTETIDDKVIVDHAAEITLIASVVPGLNEESLRKELEELPPDYNCLFERHKVEHSELFNRVILDLDNEGKRDWSNEKLLEEVKTGGMSPVLAERLHDYGRYLLICSAGDLPPNAQGIWNGSWAISNLPDYVTNIELEMATWPALPGALPECLNGYFNFIESMLPDWRENAKKLYGCRGVLASSRSSNHGQLHHFSEEYPHMFWTAGAGWMAQTFYDYWRFTGDREFLLNRALPLMKEVSLFYEDFLQEESCGKSEFIPSLSPENTPGNTGSQAARNATLDIAVARELLNNLIAACTELKVETEKILCWKKLLSRLPDYQINADGALKEWSDTGLDDNYPHRHLSHLYPAMPGLEAESSPELARACRKALDMRIENGLMQRCGWSLGHAVNVAARLKDGAGVYKFLSELAANFVTSSLLTCLDPGGWFQVDANLGFTSAVMESLVFSYPGEIDLLPALPPQWSRGQVSGIRCRGNITVKLLKWDKRTGGGCVILLSGKSCETTLKIAGQDQKILNLKSGKDMRVDFIIPTGE